MRAGALGVSALALLGRGTGVAAAAPAGQAPDGPGADAAFTPANKVGFGTARGADSPVWFTLQDGRLSELYYPDLSTPASRETQLVVTDGETFAERVSDLPVRTELVEQDAPVYRQTATGTGWHAVTTYTTDPDRPGVLIDVEFTATGARPLAVFLLHDPAIAGEGNDDHAWQRGGGLVVANAGGGNACALLVDGGFGETTTGFLGVNDGWTDLSAHHGRLSRHYTEAGPGNVVQLGQLPLDGVRQRTTTIAIGFGDSADAALGTARAGLDKGFAETVRQYVRGWRDYLGALPEPPAVLPDEHTRAVYTSSVIALAASEDKRNPGAFIASPSMPWAFGFDRDLAPVTGSYHLVWSRDQYHIATGLLAAGDRDAANRAMDFLVRAQESDGHWSQNTTVDGTPYWTEIQLDQCGAPMLLAWLLDRTDKSTVDCLVRGAEFLLGFEQDGYAAPYSGQERWENQSGYSPATIAFAVAGLVCLADLLERAGRAAEAKRYLDVADDWQSRVDGWTATPNGPYSAERYYLRVTKDGRPERGTTYSLGDNNPGEVDQRAVLDPSFLELVRLGVKPVDHPIVRTSIAVVDERLSEHTPAGRHWHRFTSDGFGEQANGRPWNVDTPDVERTYGRLWPLLAGERGEYELLAGDTAGAARRLRDIAATAGEVHQLPEQVWDNRAPAPQRAKPGTPTASATPLAWTHAQYLRLAASLEHGRPIEFPDVVAERYPR